MKKNLLIVLVVLLSLSLVLTACGESVNRDPNAILGEWKSDASDQNFAFQEDGTCAAVEAGQGIMCSYNYDGTTLNMQFDGDTEQKSMKVEISGDKMSWNVAAGTQTFTKLK